MYVASGFLFVNIFLCQDQPSLYHLFLFADSPSRFVYTLIFLFPCELLSERSTFITAGLWLCFPEAISVGGVGCGWWMSANRRCQLRSSPSFITCLKDVPPGILTTPLYSLRKSLVTLQWLYGLTSPQPKREGTAGQEWGDSGSL